MFDFKVWWGREKKKWRALVSRVGIICPWASAVVAGAVASCLWRLVSCVSLRREEPSCRVQEADPGAAWCRPGGAFSSPTCHVFLASQPVEKKKYSLFSLFSLWCLPFCFCFFSFVLFCLVFFSESPRLPRWMSSYLWSCADVARRAVFAVQDGKDFLCGHVPIVHDICTICIL